MYYTVDHLCGVLHCSTPSLVQIRSAVIEAGYRASSSHACRTALKTDAPHNGLFTFFLLSCIKYAIFQMLQIQSEKHTGLQDLLLKWSNMWVYYVVFRMTAYGFSCKFSHQSYPFFSIDSLHIEQRIMIVSITQLVD